MKSGETSHHSRRWEMNSITFKCIESESNAIKTEILNLLHMHYLGSVIPKNKSENDDVYSDQLSKLIKESLCQFDDTDDGITVTFDTTEKTAIVIADKVYHTSTEYYNFGLV